jgi:NADH-quinone oxidoreductase subunit L
MTVPLACLLWARCSGIVFEHSFGHEEGFEHFWRGGRRSHHYVHQPGERTTSCTRLHYVPQWVKWSPLRDAMILGFALAYCSTSATRPCPAARRAASTSLPFLLNKWYFDELYDLIFVRPAQWLGRFLLEEAATARSSMAGSAPTASARASRRYANAS